MKRIQTLCLVTPLILAGVAFLVIAGCDSDPTAPQENPPPLTVDAAATQAAALAKAGVDIMNELLDRSDKELINEVFSVGNVNGKVTMEFFCGGAEGEPCAQDLADAIHTWTDLTTDPPDSAVIWEDFGDGPQEIARITVDAVVDPFDNDPPESGTVTGSGVLTAGVYVSTFTIDGVIYHVGDYPASGAMTYTSPPHDVLITFDGTRCATLVIGEVTYLVDLDTGELVEECPIG